MKGKGMGTSTRENRIVRLPEVERMTGLAKTTIHRWYRDGRFPRPLRLGPKSIGWRRKEILEWLDSLPRAGGANGDVGEADRQAG